MAHDRNVNPFRVTCVGHSFISRLKSFTDGDGSTDPAMFNLRLDPERYQISFIGVPGASTRGRRSIQPALNRIGSMCPDLIFLDIGSNDLCDENVEPKNLARYIISLSRFVLMGYDIRSVALGSILPRVGSSWNSYNQRVSATNRYLRELAANEPCVYFWRHRGFSARCAINPFSADGVHPHAQRGMPKYVRSVRHAILFFEQKTRRN